MHVRIYKRYTMYKYLHVHGHHMQPNNKLFRISHAHFAQQRTTANAFARLMCSALIFHKCVKHNTIVSVDSLRRLSPCVSLSLSVTPALAALVAYYILFREYTYCVYDIIWSHSSSLYTRTHASMQLEFPLEGIQMRIALNHSSFEHCSMPHIMYIGRFNEKRTVDMDTPTISDSILRRTRTLPLPRSPLCVPLSLVLPLFMLNPIRCSTYSLCECCIVKICWLGMATQIA